MKCTTSKLTLSKYNFTSNCYEKTLSTQNEGCSLLRTEAECTKSADGGKAPIGGTGSECQWCCGRKCTSTGTKCMAKSMLVNNRAYIGRGKNGLGQNTCWTRTQLFEEAIDKVCRNQIFDLTKNSPMAKQIRTKEKCQDLCADIFSCRAVAWKRDGPTTHEGVTSQCWLSDTCTTNDAGSIVGWNTYYKTDSPEIGTGRTPGQRRDYKDLEACLHGATGECSRNYYPETAGKLCWQAGKSKGGCCASSTSGNIKVIRQGYS